VGRLKTLSNTFNLLTGISGRHNRALRDVRDWAITVQMFISEYNLYDSTDFNSLLTNSGKAKFDLTAIAYKARPLIKRAKKIKSTDVLSLITELNDNIENMRRILLNRALQENKLNTIVPSLCDSFEKLSETISDIEYK
jgi:hypothetical protein